MIFETESGSTYEVDRDDNRIRRLSGAQPGTKRLGNDGEWHRFESISLVTAGFPAVVFWGGEGLIGKMTITSTVVAVR